MQQVGLETEYIGLQDKVLERVKEQPGETYRDISSYLEADRKSVHKALTRLVTRGDIEKTDGQYFVRDFDYMDDLVASANRLAQAVPSLAAQHARAKKRWRFLGLPIYVYAIAALIGYGVGRWL